MIYGNKTISSFIRWVVELLGQAREDIAKLQEFRVIRSMHGTDLGEQRAQPRNLVASVLVVGGRDVGDQVA